MHALTHCCSSGTLDQREYYSDCSSFSDEYTREETTVCTIVPLMFAYTEVLVSPRISPEPWSAVSDIVVDNRYSGHLQAETRQYKLNEYHLRVPMQTRRVSTGSLTSPSDESDCENYPPVVRRGRRAAIFDSNNFGDISPCSWSPVESPTNSCDEDDEHSTTSADLGRRRSSVDIKVGVYPTDIMLQNDKRILIKRNTIADFNAVSTSSNGSTPCLNIDSKKGKQAFSLLKLMKTKSKEALPQLEETLANLSSSKFKDNQLASCMDLHWRELVGDKCGRTPETVSANEERRREAVWELFRSECVFLIKHLMVLKHCFLEPLKKVQVEGHLMYAEPRDLFGNLDELCYVSYTFCRDFISMLLKDVSKHHFVRNKVVIKALQKLSTLSRDGGAYQTYCLNYVTAINYLHRLRKHDDFAEFEKWCEQDPRCNRLHFADLLVAPMQHCTKLPLLLHNIRKYTDTGDERGQITGSIQKMESSLRELEEKIRHMRNYDRVRDIQQHLVWPAITEIDPKAFIPEFLRTTLLRQPCERLLANSDRQLIHEGPLSLVDATKLTDMYMILFDDVLLLTKTKKPTRKLERVAYVVYRQPISLDRFHIHDISLAETAVSGLKNAFVLVHISRYQQIIGVYTLQASNAPSKMEWLSQLRLAHENFILKQCRRSNSTSNEVEDVGDEDFVFPRNSDDSSNSSMADGPNPRRRVVTMGESDFHTKNPRRRVETIGETDFTKQKRIKEYNNPSRPDAVRQTCAIVSRYPVVSTSETDTCLMESVESNLRLQKSDPEKTS